ncbi:MAG: crossover junction endodeoxyribonuclease RuvC [Planctomycetes bacterium]|nr:crossover junction endodeoxyribonuclease RuvC [Planctomycetota bacterium]
MRILGIDPGSVTTGYAAVEVSGSRTTLVECGVIRPGKCGLPERLARISAETGRLVERIAPDAVVVETSYWGRSAQSSIKVAEVRGAIISTAAARGVKVHELAPAEVKKGVTGRGQASKEQVEFMVKRIAGLDGEISPKDASDAMAIAIAFSNRAVPGTGA